MTLAREDEGTPRGKFVLGAVEQVEGCGMNWGGVCGFSFGKALICGINLRDAGVKSSIG